MEIYISDFISSLPEHKKSPIYSLSFLITEKFKKIYELSKKEKIMVFKCYEYLIKILTFHFIIFGQGHSEIKRNIFFQISEIRKKINSTSTIVDVYNDLKERITLSKHLRDKNVSKEKIKPKIIEIDSKS
ncbi:MAG: hypothetical protein RSF67_08810 [Clostridia bacterium]